MMSEDTAEVISKPLDVNGVHFSNRIVVPPMVTNKGILTEEGREWYKQLASGGAALVIVESTPLSLFFTSNKGPARFTVESLKPLVDVIHKGGAKAVLQIFPALDSITPRAPPPTIPVEALEELTVKYGEAARICREAGFDGIEIYASYGFIISQFSCRVANTRKDRYGAFLPTLAQDIVASVKHACPGPGFLVLYRHTVPDPTRVVCFADTVSLMGALANQGVDIFALSPSGTYEHPGCFAQALRKQCGPSIKLPLIGDNGLNEPARARAVLQEGLFELVAIGRGHIADPEWARKVLEHRDSEIIKCQRCNIGCHQNLRKGIPIKCILEDREPGQRDIEELHSLAPKPKKVES